MKDLDRAVAALGPEALREPALVEHIHPLFSRSLQSDRKAIYLANHSLGRPLDCTAEDIQEGLNAWYAAMGEGWSCWNAEILAFREHVATLLHAPNPHCIIPKTNAAQGLRAVLNRYSQPIRVVATRSEFDSIDITLKTYAARGRIVVDWVKPREEFWYRYEDFEAPLNASPELLVISLIFFDTGQLLGDLEPILAKARSSGVKVLLDLYHAAGVVPVDLQKLNVDFAVGGSYKYLRGGPGAAWLYASPQSLDGGERTLDAGWFALRDPFAFERPETPHFASGGDGWLDATPAVLPFYQARAGLEFTLAIGVERLRAYSLMQQALLIDLLREQGITAINADRPHGAFLTVKAPKAKDLAARLRDESVVVDARSDSLRICADILNRSDQLSEAVRRLGSAFRVD